VEEPKKVIGVIDHQNIFNQGKESDIKLDQIYRAIMKMIGEFGEVIDVRSFVPVFQTASGPWKILNELLIKYGVSFELCSVLRDEEKQFKDTVDFSVWRWMIPYHSCVDTVVIFTGDGDFTVAINWLKLRKKEVLVCTLNLGMTSDALFQTAPVKQLLIDEKQFTVSPANPFLMPLSAVTNGKRLDKEGRKKIQILAKAEEMFSAISRSEENLTYPILKKALQKNLGVTEEVSQSIIEIMAGLDVIQFHQQILTIPTLKVSTSIRSLEETIAP